MLKSPSAGSLTVVLMRVMTFCELIVASTRYLPSIVIATTWTFSGCDDVAVAAFLELLPAPERDGIRARQPRRLDEPGGFSHRSS